MSTSIRSILACLMFATLGLGFACGDSSPGNTRAGSTSGTGGGSGTGDTSGATSGTSSGATTGATSSGATSGTTSTAATSGAGGASGTPTTTGSAGASTTTTAAGTGGAGTGGAGGAGGGSSMACGSNGQPDTGPLLGRCSPMACTDRNCGTAVGKGGFLTVDDFEIANQSTPMTGPNAVINMTWPSRDKRNGSWHQYSDPLAMATMQLAPSGGGGSPDSLQAIHYWGMRGAYGATLALPLGGAMASGEAGCYDASAYDGISFWIKGNTAAGNTQVKFNVQSSITEPVDSGGGCMSGCRDHFAIIVPFTANWTRVKVPWADLKRQNCTTSVPATPPNFQPQKQILAVSFQQVDPAKSFDFWIDDLVLSVDSKPTTDFASTVTQALFSEMFPGAVVPYTYQGFLAAVNKWGSGLARNANPVDNRREAAAFLAHIAHETGSLTTNREKCKDTCGKVLAPQTMPLACTGTEPTRDCTSAPYYGRGAMQLTGLGNYQNAESKGFTGIVANADLVATNVDFAFGTAAWFWTTYQSAKGICHDAINLKDFGQTINIINGGIECVAGNTEQNSRIALFKTFSAALGMNAGGKLACP